MLLAIDTHSDAYHAGQMMGPFLLAAIAIVVLWASTRRWRRPFAESREDLDRTTRLARERTRQVVLGTVVIVAAAVTLDAVQGGQPGDYGSAASKGPTNVTITPPTTLGGYQLMTGTQADQLRARLDSMEPGQHNSAFYAAAGDSTKLALIVVARTSATDTKLADDLDRYSADYLNTDFMAGAKIANPKVVPSGPAGGETQCGQNTAELLCSWTDSGSAGSLVTNLDSGITIDKLASLTAQFRTAAEH